MWSVVGADAVNDALLQCLAQCCPVRGLLHGRVAFKPASQTVVVLVAEPEIVGRSLGADERIVNLRRPYHLHLLSSRDMGYMQCGTAFNRHFQCLCCAFYAGLPASDILVLPHRDILPVALLRLLEVLPDGSLVLAMYKNADTLQREQLPQRHIPVNQHVAC